MKKAQVKTLDVAEVRMLRWMCRATKLVRIKNKRRRGTAMNVPGRRSEGGMVDTIKGYSEKGPSGEEGQDWVAGGDSSPTPTKRESEETWRLIE